MSKQTAVEWLIDNLKGYDDDCEIFQIAKAMEKQQSIYDYCEGFKASSEGWNGEYWNGEYWNGEYGLDNILDLAGEIDAEQYYINTYKDYCKDCKPGDEQ